MIATGNRVIDLQHCGPDTTAWREARSRGSQSRLQDSWAAGHTVIQVVSLCQGSLSKKKTDRHFLALWSALRIWGWKSAWLSPSRGEIAEIWEFYSLIALNVWPGTALYMPFYFSKTAQDTKNFKLEQGPDLLVHGCVIQGHPNLAEIAEVLCHRTQPVNLDENITEWTLILNSLYSNMPRNFRKQCTQDKTWAIRELGNISQGILTGKSEKSITLVAREHDLSSSRRNIQFLGQLQKMNKLVCKHL